MLGRNEPTNNSPCVGGFSYRPPMLESTHWEMEPMTIRYISYTWKSWNIVVFQPSFLKGSISIFYGHGWQVGVCCGAASSTTERRWNFVLPTGLDCVISTQQWQLRQDFTGLRNAETATSFFPLKKHLSIRLWGKESFTDSSQVYTTFSWHPTSLDKSDIPS